MLLSTREATPEHSGHSGKSSVKLFIKYDEGSGAPSISGKADQAGTVLPGKEKAQGSAINVYIRYMMQKDRDSLFPEGTGDRTFIK